MRAQSHITYVYKKNIRKTIKYKLDVNDNDGIFCVSLVCSCWRHATVS